MYVAERVEIPDGSGWACLNCGLPRFDEPGELWGEFRGHPRTPMAHLQPLPTNGGDFA